MKTQRLQAISTVLLIGLGGCESTSFKPDDKPDLQDTGSPQVDDTATSSTPPVESAEPKDTSTDTAPPDTGEAPPPKPEWAPGKQWVRTHEMMISGLVVQMDAPSSSTASTYFDTFGANTAHFWQTGLPDEVGAWRASSDADYQWISWVDGDGMSSANGVVGGGVGANPDGRVAYQIGDEPRNASDLAALQTGIDAVRSTDPDALIIVNFGNAESMTDREALIETYANSMGGDIISYDQYGYDYNTYEHMAQVRRVALEHDMPYWRYLRAFSEAGDSGDWPVESDMRWDAFKGLVYGFTGHTWFLYQADPAHSLETSLFSSTGSWSASRSEWFDIAAQLNFEMINVGETITQLTSTDVRYIPSVSLYTPDDTTDWSEGAGDDPYITGIEAIDLSIVEYQDVLVGFFKDDAGEIYVMLQNPTHESADWPVMVSDEATFRVDFDFSSAPSSLNSDRLEVLDNTSGTVGSLSLQTNGGSNRYLEVSLAAGDAILFKYATASDFVRRGE